MYVIYITLTTTMPAFNAPPAFRLAVVRPAPKAVVGQQELKQSLVGSKTPFLSSRLVGAM